MLERCSLCNGHVSLSSPRLSFYYFEQDDLELFRSEADYEQFMNPKTSLNLKADLLKRSVPILYAHKCTPLKRKRYLARGDLTTFCLELIKDVKKPELVIKFGAEQRGVLETLREYLLGLVQNKRFERRDSDGFALSQWVAAPKAAEEEPNSPKRPPKYY